MENTNSNYGYDAHIKDTVKLDWNSKPNIEPEAKNLEFQNAEIVIPNVEKADSNLDKFIEKAVESNLIFEKPNRLIFGDNLLIMQALLAEGYEGKLDMIYIDPPFNTGEEFNFVTEASLPSGQTFEKDWTMIERLAYTDTWERGIDSFLDMLYPRLQLMRRLLTETGSIYVHTDWHMVHYIKVLLDEIFGYDNLVNELIWQKIRVKKAQSIGFGNVHDTILVYSKTKDNTFHPQYTELSQEYKDSHWRSKEQATGRNYQLISMTQKGSGPPRKFRQKVIQPPPGKHWVWSQDRIDEGIANGTIVFTSGNMPRIKIYLDESKGTNVTDIWTDIYPVNSMANENVHFPTQKPEALLSRIISTSTNEGDLVADFFVGSGTTAAVAEQLKRRWIVADVSKVAIHLTRNRLIDLSDTN